MSSSSLIGKSQFLLIIIFVLSLIVPHSTLASQDSATALRVVDGDTLEILLNGTKEKVRLIGVDTPEVHESAKLHRDAVRTEQDLETIRELGKRASEFTKGLVKKGDPIRLEYDWQKRDKYGRILAFVWLDDGRMLNETIVCAGYGNAYTKFPFKQEYMDRFLACQRMAAEKGLGLWESAPVPPEPETPPVPPSPSDAATSNEICRDIRGNKNSMIYHVPECPSYNQVSKKNIVCFKTEDKAIEAEYRKAGNCP